MGERLLRINLTTKQAEIEEIPSKYITDFIGGKGLAARLFTEEVDPNVDPLSPENKLIFAIGPLQGTLAPLSGRHVIYSKSPQTGTICDSYSGGHFGPEMAYCGVQVIIVEGASDEPVYISFTDGQVSFRNASRLWGLDTTACEDEIRKELGNARTQIACIGPAGENLVLYASIINNKHNAAARGGLGAVMGAKRLKAIALHGKRDIPIPNIDQMLQVRAKAIQALADSGFSENFSRFGTSLTVETTNIFGIFPTNNFQSGQMKDFEKIGGQALLQTVVGQRACFGCTLSCNKISKFVKFGKAIYTDRNEYETYFALGGACGNYGLSELLEAGDLCNKLGMDTISAGVSIGYGMELLERGYLAPCEGIRFGNPEIVSELVRKIAYREGIGNLLAEGTKRMSEQFPAPASEFAMHVKGLEIPGYDPRGATGMGVSYATANRGACHNYAYTIGDEMWAQKRDRYEYDGKGTLVKQLQDITAAVNSAILCKFPYDNVIWEENITAEMINAATSRAYTGKDICLIGEKIYNLERWYNCKAGFNKLHDTIPGRFIREAMPEGPAKGRVCSIDTMLEEYYSAREWDNQTGVPLKTKLMELGLTEEAEKI